MLADRARRWGPLAGWSVAAVGFALTAWWLLAGPPPVPDPGVIMFNAPGVEGRLSMTLVDSGGSRRVIIRNEDTRATDVDVELALPGVIDQTNGLTPHPKQNGLIPTFTIGDAIENFCFPSTAKDVDCRFHLEPGWGRSFDYRSDPSLSWTTNRGARWTATTPELRPSPISGGFDETYENTPSIDVRVLLDLPAESEIVAGPTATWDNNIAAQVFTYQSSGRIFAPLVYDERWRPAEEFGLFLLAALLGITVDRVIGAARRASRGTLAPIVPDRTVEGSVVRPAASRMRMRLSASRSRIQPSRALGANVRRPVQMRARDCSHEPRQSRQDPPST